MILWLSEMEINLKNRQKGWSQQRLHETAHMSASMTTWCWLSWSCHFYVAPPPPWYFHSKTTAGWVCVTVPQPFSPSPPPSFPSLPLCLDGTAFSIIYRAFKSLMSCAVCKSLVLLWAEQLMWWIKQGLYTARHHRSLKTHVRVNWSIERVNNKTMKRSHQNCLCLLPFLKGDEKENKGILYIDSVLGLWA